MKSSLLKKIYHHYFYLNINISKDLKITVQLFLFYFIKGANSQLSIFCYFAFHHKLLNITLGYILIGHQDTGKQSIPFL